MSYLEIYKSSLFTAVRVRVDLRTPPGVVTTGVGAVTPVGVTTTDTVAVTLVGALTYINYWTEHSSNDSSAEVQGAALTYYVPSWAAPCPIFICSVNLEQSRVDSCTALSTLRPQIAMVWSNCLFVVEI